MTPHDNKIEDHKKKKKYCWYKFHIFALMINPYKLHVFSVSKSKSENTKALSAFSIDSSRHRQFLEACPGAPIPIEPKSLDQWEPGRGRADQWEKRERCVVPGILLTHPRPCFVRDGSQHCWRGGCYCSGPDLQPVIFLSQLSLLCSFRRLT